MTQFYSLAVRDIRRETPGCVSIAFEVPASTAHLFRFEPGQNVTLRLPIHGEEVRRSYSICSSPLEKELRVAVKHIDDGKFSGHANINLKAGDKVDVLPPSGRFYLRPEPSRKANYLAFAAGSGITPVISIIKAALAQEPESTFTLVYGNRNRGSIIFKEQIDGLKNRYMNRFIVHHILSREEMETQVYQGRINEAKCEELSKHLLRLHEVDQVFICGPEQMTFSTADWLLKKGIPKEKIHFELFSAPGEQRSQKQTHDQQAGKTSRVKLKLDGVYISYELPFDGTSVLDGALQQGADLPYACKGGVCATCRAKLVKGQVEMDTNYALEQDELNKGYILTCQSHPRTEEVEIDFDAR